jgi:hypothetical protein
MCVRLHLLEPYIEVHVQMHRSQTNADLNVTIVSIELSVIFDIIKLTIIVLGSAIAEIFTCESNSNGNFWCGTGKQCQDTGSLGQFFSNLSGSASTTISGESTSISGDSTGSSDTPVSGQLSSTARRNLALGLGLGNGVPMLLLAGYAFWRYRRRSSKRTMIPSKPLADDVVEITQTRDVDRDSCYDSSSTKSKFED